MNKQEFLNALRDRLAALPCEVEECIAFYAEMIDDRVEDGLSEEEAVAAIGTATEVAAQILADIPLSRLVKQRIKPQRRLRIWETLLLAIGSPVWASLLIAAFAVVISLYAALWSLVASAWAVFASMVGGALGGLLGGGILAFTASTLAGLSLIGAALVCAGLSIFAFRGCIAATRGSVALTRLILLGVKKCFIRREKVQ